MPDEAQRGPHGRHDAGRVADGSAELVAADRASPVLNKLSPKELEEGLNDGLPDSLRFLVAATSLSAFEPSRFREKIGTYKVIHHKTGDAVLLTDESKLVQSLAEVVNNEPAITVTVIADADGEGQEKLEDRFVSVARSILSRQVIE